ncbi:hypothetical protein [Janthinobacterium sp. CG3]|uniref:hypothetical protein n=1 Tax=Janthinobacterium sp. CG3 TaxID=1075768 RepID=UPI0003727BFB|nr:hypothetical protein [Janthinobacterium sp. CG3]
MAKTILDADLVNPVVKRLIVGTTVDDGVNQFQVTGAVKVVGVVGGVATSDGGVASFRRTGATYNAGVFMGATEASGIAWLDFSGSVTPARGSIRLGAAEVIFMTPGAAGVTGTLAVSSTIQPGTFTVATLPAGANGKTAYASNGRKVGEAAAAGTGIPVYYSNGAWRRHSDDTAAAA